MGHIQFVLLLAPLLALSTPITGLSTYDYFYHGCSREQYINFLLNTYLDAYTRNQRLDPSFLKLRHDNHLYNGPLSVEHYLRENGDVSDHTQPHRTYLLATSPSVPANRSLAEEEEDAVLFASKNNNVRAPHAARIIDNYAMLNNATKASLVDTTESFKAHVRDEEKSGITGVLLRIGLPRTYAARLVYLSRDFGKPICMHANPHNDAHARMKQFLSAYRADAAGAIQSFCTNNHKLDEMLHALLRFQTRILLHKQIFRNPGIINVQAYHNIPYDELRAYEEKIKEALQSEDPQAATHHPFYRSTLFPHGDARKSDFYYTPIHNGRKGWLQSFMGLFKG